MSVQSFIRGHALRGTGLMLAWLAATALVIDRGVAAGVNRWIVVGGWLLVSAAVLALVATLTTDSEQEAGAGEPARIGPPVPPRPGGAADPRQVAATPLPEAGLAGQGTYATVAPAAVAAAAAAGPAPEPAEAWGVGERIADLYEVRQVHGQGAMGMVYRVRHLGWDVDLAVKSPRPELFASQADKQRFVQEAETWVSLGLHPNVCGCHYVRTLGGVPRVFAEYVDGGSLREWIDDRRLYQGGSREALARILDLAIQTAWGLAHAHDHGVVHQDVKPANVLVGGDGTAKVTDFGLARARELGGTSVPAGPDGATMLVTVGGMTPAYASPEQAAGGQVGRRSDVWSFAVSVLELFTGEVTWLAGQVAGAALAGYREPGASAGLAVPLPPSVADLLAECLRDDPAERPASMAAVAGRLAEIYQRAIGSRYGRVPPEPARLRADELSNRALSLLDLGRVTEAEAAFDAARALDPQHLEATFNAGLLRWRTGALHDDELVAQMEAVRASSGNSWQARHLLAQVHLERGDPESARPLLEQAARQAPDDPQVQADLEQARGDGCAVSRTLCALTGQGDEPVLPTHLSADRRLALSRRPRARSGDVLGVWDARTGRHLRDLQHASDVLTPAGFTESVLVSAVCLSRDGSRTLTGSTAGVLYLWNTETGECLRTLDHHRQAPGSMSRGRITSICLADNGRFAVSRDESGNVRLWDLRKRRCIGLSQGGACLAGNGRIAVSGGRGGAVLAWDLDAGRLQHTLTGHGEQVWSVTLSPDGRFALSGEGGYNREAVEYAARLWDLGSGRCVRVLAGDPSSISAVALGADARLALTGHRDGAVHVWDAGTGRRLRTLRGHRRPVTSIAVSPDGRLALSAEHDPGVLGQLTVRVWELATGRCQHTIEEGLCLESGGTAALASDLQGRVRAWAAPQEPYACAFRLCRPTAHAELAQLHSQVGVLVREAEQAMTEQRLPAARDLLEEARRTPGFERAASVLEPWRRLARAARRAGVRAVWPSTTLQGHRSGVASLCVSADGRLALSAGGQDRTVRVWDVETGRCLRTLQGHTFDVRSVAVSADGRLAVSGGGGFDRDSNTREDTTVRVWDVETGRCLHVLRGHTWFVGPVDLSPDGRLALSAGGQDRTVRVWDVETGRCLRTLAPRGYRLRTIAAHARAVSAVSLSPDGRIAVSAGDDGEPGRQDHTVRVWDLESGRCLHVLRGHDSAVSSIRVSPDAKVALSGAWADPSVRVWDLAAGQCLGTLDVYPGGNADRRNVREIHGVDSLCLSADGRYALTARAMEAAVRVWDLATGHCLRTLEVPGSQVGEVCLSADGRYALASVTGGAVQVWEIDWELEVREPADWDEGARPYLTIFLTQHTPLVTGDAGGPAWRGAPRWDEAGFKRLLRQLGYAGYGWLRPAGVRAELERMARDWQAPPPLPGAWPGG